MRILFIVFLTTITSSLLYGQQKEVLLIDSLMKTAYERGIFNGNILISKADTVIYEKSWGFAEGNKTVPLSKDLKFDIGSISKEFNGVAIMLLQEKGKLTLDDPLQKYFPEFPEWAAQVKIKHLITYTSGIPVLGPASDGNDSLIYSSLCSLKNLSASPGTVYIYNHINVSLQRKIIEKVSELSYADFVKKYLFAPADMTQSLIDYPVEGEGMARAFDNEGNNVPYAQATKGWVRLTAGDLYKWIIALNTHKIINAESLKELSVNFPGGESSLGTVKFEGDTLIWHQHQGSNSHYEAAYYTHLPENITLVMMTNNQQMKVWPLKTAIVNILQHQPFTIPKKSLYLSIRDKVLEDLNTGMRYYKTLKATAQDRYDFSFEIGDLISTAKYLMRRDKPDDAIQVLETAVKLEAKVADLSYGYELMGDCYRQKGDAISALQNYRQAVKLLPENKNALARINELNAK